MHEINKANKTKHTHTNKCNTQQKHRNGTEFITHQRLRTAYGWGDHAVEMFVAPNSGS